MTFRRHFLPPLAGFLMFVAVFGFFNSEFISGQIAYYLYSRHANVNVLDAKAAASSIDKNAPPEVIINKINVTAPVLFTQTQVNEAAFEQALQHGTVHYPGTAMPGQAGNVVIFGHSSGQWWAPGDYKFVFTLLNKLTVNDKILVDYQGTRYIYNVYSTEVVTPNNMSVLTQGNGHTLTLITCTPVGTSAKRLIVQAKQISPIVTNGVSTPKLATIQNQPALPGAAPSFWHDLRQLF